MRRFFKTWQWFILLPLMVLIYIGIDYSLRHIIILPGFLTLERHEADKDLSRCTNAILSEEHHLQQVTMDWAEFDDMYRFVLDKNSAFEEANLQMEVLSNVGIDLLYILNSEGKNVWNGTYSRELEKEINLTELPSHSFPSNHALLKNSAQPPSGLLLTEHMPMIVVSHPILPTSGEGVAHGTLIMGKFLSESIIEDLKKQIRINFSIKSINAPNLSDTEKEAIADLSPGARVHRYLNHETLQSYTILQDIEGVTALLICADLPRKIFERGRKTALFASVTILLSLTFVIFFAASWFSLFNSKIIKKQHQIEELVRIRTKELQESENRFSALSDAAFDAIFLSEKGICLLQNKTAQKMFGYSDEEVVGRPGTDWIAVEYKDIVVQKMMKGVETAYEVIALRKDGTTFPAEIQGRKAIFEGREVRVTSLQDITIRKEAEKEKARLEEKLRRLQRLEAIGTMAGGVAHDLNNILSGVVAYPEVLLAQIPEESELRKPLEATHKAGLRAAEVVSDLLTVARAATSVKEISNLNSIVLEYIDSPEYQKMKSHHKKVNFTLNLAPILLNFNCSPVHIRKCLMNLITNGCEAIESKGELAISTRNQTVDTLWGKRLNIEQGEYVVLYIGDSGSGISNKDKEHIFDPFYTKKSMGRSGTGLGLTVVWNTIQDHRGGVIIDSNPKGTIFELFFPATADSLPQNQKRPQLEDLQGNGEYILVVDDDILQRDIATKILRTLNYTVCVVSSGEEALSFLHTNRVDLVLLDMLMEPGMSGVETFVLIRESYPQQKAVIVSGYSESEEIEKVKQLGIEMFIKKPYTMDQIGEALQLALK